MLLPQPYRPASSVVDKKHPDPLMGRGYISVRATGGAVASFPYRGRPWMGWMFLCFFLCAKESKKLLLVLSKKNTPHQNITQTSLQQPPNQQSATAQTDALPVDSGNPDNRHAPRHQRSAAASNPSPRDWMPPAPEK